MRTKALCDVRRRSVVGAVRRIVVGVHGSLGSLQALRWAVDEARERRIPLVPVLAWVPPGGDFAERSHPSPYLRRVWEEAASKRLRDAFDDCFGGIPDDVRVSLLVERGDPAQVLVDVANQPGDLLVIGSGRRNPFIRALHRSVGRYCLAHAHAPVLAVPPSALMDEMRHGLRPWPLGRRALVPDLDHLGE
jgi:nucleotide-binding universal stress UspA family protein